MHYKWQGLTLDLRYALLLHSFKKPNEKTMNTSKYSGLHFNISLHKLCISYCYWGFQMVSCLKFKMFSGSDFQTSIPVQMCNNCSYISYAVSSCKMTISRTHIHESIFILYTSIIFDNIYEPLLGLLTETIGSLLLYHKWNSEKITCLHLNSVSLQTCALNM